MRSDPGASCLPASGRANGLVQVVHRSSTARKKWCSCCQWYKFWERGGSGPQSYSRAKSIWLLKDCASGDEVLGFVLGLGWVYPGESRIVEGSEAV